MSSGTCIYCKRQGIPFHREHVMPQAFGTFEQNQFFLYDSVCLECNGFFGRTLERLFSRDSPEALLRLHYRVKPASKARDILYQKTTLRVAEPGKWRGAQFKFVPSEDGTQVFPEPEPQVGLRKKPAVDWTWFTEDHLSDPNVLLPYKGQTPGEVDLLIVGSPDEKEKLLARLAELGVKLNDRHEFAEPVTSGSTILAEIDSRLDVNIFRAVAKIAFNYVACVCGPDFALQPDFNEIREYIRDAKQPAWRGPVVRPVSDPILFADSREWRQTNGHLITFDWNLGGLLAQVSLFNSTTYRVLLCPLYSGLTIDGIPNGHHFDIESRTISPLLSVSRALIP
jgi:hypothetical protein